MSRETSLLIGVLRDTVFIIGGVLLHNASELLVEGFRSLVAAGYGVFRAAVFLHDFDVGQPKGGRIFTTMLPFSSKENSLLGASSGRGLTLAYGSGLEK